MCSCKDIKMGSYTRQASMLMKRGKWEKRVGIDVCLVQEIAELWYKGIETIESCCGHNVAPSYIAVVNEYEYIEKMKVLGYKPCSCNMCGQTRENIFKAKSV